MKLQCLLYIKLILIIVYSSFFCLTPSFCQIRVINNPEYPGKSNVIQVPFRYINHFIIVEVIINSGVPLQFIFDTGAEHTILLDKELMLLCGMKSERLVKVRGSDQGEEIQAMVVAPVDLKIHSSLRWKIPVIVPEVHYLNFDPFTGTTIHGILGADIMQNYVIRIDYQKQFLQFLSPDQFSPPSNSLILPFEKFKNRIFFNVQLDPDLDCRLMLDTGAGVTCLLDGNNLKGWSPPPKSIPGNVGYGMTGPVTGYIGRIPQMHFKQLALKNVLICYQVSKKSDAENGGGNRQGILGNAILERATLWLDYPGQRIILKPGKRWQEPFHYDRSGIELIAAGTQLNTFIIQGVLPGSPADSCLLQAGDILHKINGRKAHKYELRQILQLLQSRKKKQIELEINRGGEFRSCKLVLRDLI